MKSKTRLSTFKIPAVIIAILYIFVTSGTSFASFTIKDEKILGKEFYEKLKGRAFS